ncbi:MAG: outer membrane beta-barrel protein [Chitinophagaceae bacterium]|nr:outer membrane beta-barrel protein [Chitinophagaceae bacterium]
MYNLLGNKIRGIKNLLLAVLLLTATKSFAQKELYLPNHDDKKYYLGIGVLYNTGRFQLTHDPKFLQSDSVMAVNPENAGGIGLAGLHTYRLSNRFEVRAIFPQLLFSYKNLTYYLKYPDPAKEEQPVMTKKVESILLGLPVHIKFRSDRIENFRVYMFAGGKVEYDLASNARAKRAEEMIKLKKLDFGIEAGIGFNFYFPVFILSPEIKISNGLTNSHSRDESLKFSNVIDKLNSRMVVFSLIFEG